MGTRKTAFRLDIYQESRHERESASVLSLDRGIARPSTRDGCGGDDRPPDRSRAGRQHPAGEGGAQRLTGPDRAAEEIGPWARHVDRG